MITQIFLASFAIIAAMMIAVWLLSIPLKNVGLIDIAWGLGFVLVAWTCFLTVSMDDPAWSHLLLPCLTTIWGLRLTAYLAFRNIGHPEDHRYAAMRERHGSAFVWSSLLRVFALQAVILWIISLPIQMSAARPAPGDPCLILASAGIVFWTLGLFFETVRNLSGGAHGCRRFICRVLCRVSDGQRKHGDAQRQETQDDHHQQQLVAPDRDLLGVADIGLVPLLVHPVVPLNFHLERRSVRV